MSRKPKKRKEERRGQASACTPSRPARPADTVPQSPAAPAPAPPPLRLIAFTPWQNRLGLGLLILCVLLVGVRIHGYSLPSWQAFIDGQPPASVLCGRARHIRSDDWLAELPIALAQLTHRPPFPLRNENIGLETNQLAPFKVPIRHPLILFKPTTWGFFLGPDIGLSWMWCSTLLGMVYVWFLVFLIISRNDTRLAILGSVSIVLSPFFQFWSLHKAEIPLFAGVMFVATSFMLTARRRGVILVHAGVLGWAAGCYMLAFIYPPYQVGVGYLLLFMLTGFILTHRQHIAARDGNGTIQLIGFAAAALVAAGVAITFHVCARDVIHLTAETVYPGKRFSTGGDYPWWKILSNNFMVHQYHMLRNGRPFLKDLSWGPMKNICEYASGWMFFPFVALMVAWEAVRERRRPGAFTACVFGYVLFFLVYVLLGFPRWLSAVSLFSRMPAYRALMGLVLANTVLLVSFLSRPAPGPGSPWRGQAAGTALWVLLLLLNGIKLCSEWPVIPTSYVVTVALLTGVLSFTLLNPRRRIAFMGVTTALTALSTLWFNPVVRGGTAALYHNPVADKILKVDRAHQGQSVWVTFGSPVLQNLPRVLGVQSLNGVHPYPQFELWRRIDPAGQETKVYNRYGNVTFTEGTGDSVQLRVVANNHFQVRINPALHVDRLRALGATHLLVVSSRPAAFDRSSELTKLFSFQNKHIYKLRPPAGPLPPQERNAP